MRAILTFHSVDDSGSVLSYPVEAFTHLMNSIARSGVPVMELDQLISSQAGVALTFDDGMRSIRTAALPILRDLQFPAHLFLTTGAVGSTNQWPTQPADAPCMPMLDWDDVEYCVDSGIRIESHTHMHPDLRALTSPQILQECESADAEIEARTGRTPRHFAYPYGYFDSRVADIVRPRYKTALTTRLAFLPDRIDDPAALPRLDTYYMKGAGVRARPFGPAARCYLAGRAFLRALRGAMR